MNLIDSHCHLDVTDFADDLPEVIARAVQSGVSGFVVPAISASGWPHLANLAALHAGLHPAYGLHPMFLAEHTDADLDALPQWVSRSECVAVGECGLDFFVSDLDPIRQETIFIAHIRLAAETGKPLIIHARRATERVIQLLRRHGPTHGVIHSYSGSLEQAQSLIDMGFMLGIGGPITYPRSRRIREIVRECPLSHLLLETDAPDQPMSGEQGRRNEPAKLVRVAEAMAEIRGIPMADVAAQTRCNAERLFGLAA
jgi:TatD DNase family protein